MPGHSSQGFPSQRLSRAAVRESGYSIPVPDLTNRQLCRKHSLGLAWLKLPWKALNPLPSPSPFVGVRPASHLKALPACLCTLPVFLPGHFSNEFLAWLIPVFAFCFSEDLNQQTIWRQPLFHACFLLLLLFSAFNLHSSHFAYFPYFILWYMCHVTMLFACHLLI